MHGIGGEEEVRSDRKQVAGRFKRKAHEDYYSAPLNEIICVLSMCRRYIWDT